MESRGKSPLTIDRVTRSAKQNIAVFGLLYGQEHRKGRRDARETMAELRESRPGMRTIAFLCQSSGAMAPE